jgi:hypothetical protein
MFERRNLPNVGAFLRPPPFFTSCGDQTGEEGLRRKLRHSEISVVKIPQHPSAEISGVG